MIPLYGNSSLPAHDSPHFQMAPESMGKDWEFGTEMVSATGFFCAPALRRSRSRTDDEETVNVRRFLSNPGAAGCVEVARGGRFFR